MGNFTATTTRDQVLTVTELNRHVAQVLQTRFSRIWVKGEISNFTQAASGHWYFSIKDSGAMVRAVMFRSRAQATGIVPKVGDQFEFYAGVSLYEPRGDYQLIVESLRRAGRGDLHEAFLRLRDKLAAEGLFDVDRKVAVPAMPRAIGVVTSLAAAALRDVLTTLARRMPHIPVIVYPAPVQGAEAAGQLVQALQTAIDRAEVDTLLLVRGGGSIEDLWSFNDERLARLVASSPIPVISGVGHETDFTICDFAADVRAPTPTAAAELAGRDRRQSLELVQNAGIRLDYAWRRLHERRTIQLDRAAAGLVSPQERMRLQGERLDALRGRLARVGMAIPERRKAALQLLVTRLPHCVPRVDIGQDRLHDLAARMAAAMAARLEQAERRVDVATQTLHALSPRHVLARGYAIVRKSNQEVVKNALDLKIGDLLSVEFERGTAQVDVSNVHGLL